MYARIVPSINKDVGPAIVVANSQRQVSDGAMNAILDSWMKRQDKVDGWDLEDEADLLLFFEGCGYQVIQAHRKPFVPFPLEAQNG